MSNKIENLLSTGLKEGFAGGTEVKDIKRDIFNLKSSHLENETGIYHDEWFADRTGGGQEIVKVGESSYTRVYAGGTISIERLDILGITKEDVMKFLKKQILQSSEKIRLFTDFESEIEGDWQYSYKVLDKDIEIPLTYGKEVIRYKDNLVFVHDFIISPVD